MGSSCGFPDQRQPSLLAPHAHHRSTTQHSTTAGAILNRCHARAFFLHAFKGFAPVPRLLPKSQAVHILAKVKDRKLGFVGRRPTTTPYHLKPQRNGLRSTINNYHLNIWAVKASCGDSAIYQNAILRVDVIGHDLCP